jgi:hypothetical protein
VSEDKELRKIFASKKDEINEQFGNNEPCDSFRSSIIVKKVKPRRLL